MPTWILLSLAFPVLLGVVNILDKLIVDRFAPAVYFYAFWIGVYEIVIGLAIVSVTSAYGFETRDFLGGMLTGSIRAVGLLLILSALKRGQVIRVVPVWYLYPLMVAVMAAGFLEEDLSGLAWVAVVLAVAGAVLVSWQGNAAGGSFGSLTVLALALGGAVTFAVSIVLTKHFISDDSFWRFYGSTRLGFAITLLSVIALPDVRRRALGMVRNRGLMKMVALVEVVVTVAVLVSFAAINLGPVSLVAAISAIQPSLVFLYSLGLATIAPTSFGSWIARGTLRPQVAGIAAITAGVVLISIQSE